MLRMNKEAVFNPYLFKSNLTPRLERERNLFVTYHRALCIQIYLNDRFYFPSYYSFARFEVVKCQLQAPSMSALIDRIGEHVQAILTDPNGKNLEKFKSDLKDAAKKGEDLFNTMLSNPELLPSSELELHLNDACKLDLHFFIKTVVKQHPALPIHLVSLFHTAMASLNISTAKTLVKLGLDINKKISINAFTPQMRDFDDVHANWLTQLIISLPWIFLDPLSALSVREGQEINTVSVEKMKSVINFLLESGLDPDEEINESLVYKDAPHNCRAFCQMLLQELKNKSDALSTLDHAYIDVLTTVVNAPLRVVHRP